MLKIDLEALEAKAKQKLCSKDKRNPMFFDLYEFDDEPPEPRNDCACDNCFYGRDEMALDMLALISRLRKAEGVVLHVNKLEKLCRIEADNTRTFPVEEIVHAVLVDAFEALQAYEATPSSEGIE